ncbi:hypothetical protein TrVFT333_007747 [Trichoderma virens FT-333]|nr:hypothetical protein TrVFT333_007747 [Trichoderma virens FT-333]
MYGSLSVIKPIGERSNPRKYRGSTAAKRDEDEFAGLTRKESFCSHNIDSYSHHDPQSEQCYDQPRSVASSYHQIIKCLRILPFQEDKMQWVFTLWELFYESEFDSEESTIDLKDINWEHHGPGSWLSICSKPGIRWVSDKVGSIEFREVAQGLVADWTKHLTLSQYPTTQHGPDLDFETAWRYSTSYFDSTQDAAFGVVDRADFEDHLQRHFQSAGTDYGDAASYALRNAVYAVGCRAMPAYTCSDPSQNQDESLQLFFNALSELPNLLFMPSGLRAVQALAVMTSYAELLGSPSVEYMLCGAAARLAQSKGLHRQPATAWCLPEREKFHRECIFWTIYCYDKGLALRCGRPSMLENDEISCQIPTRTPSGSAVDLDVLVASIRHAQICADIFKSLYSPKSLNKPPDDLLQQIRGIDQKLEDEAAKKSSSYREEPDMNQAHAIRLLRAYNGSIIALYASFHYPWIRPRLRKQREVPSPDSISAISARVAEAARRILTTLTECRPVCISTGPTAFYFPMLAIINLFIYILEYPTTKTAQSDIALLDIGVGHFGQIYHLTSGRMSFQFSRQVAVLACKAVERAASRAANNATPETSMNNSKDALDDPNDTVVPLHDALISPGQWSALSADLFNDFSMEGEMIML